MTASTAIVVREPVFEHERGRGGIWNPRLPELSHTLNGFQLALPYLEPYFIDAVRSANGYIKEERLKEEVRAFCSQEAHHARRHRDYGRVLRKRYPRLAEFETKLQQSLVHSRRNDPLPWRIAYTAGYEAITAQLSRWLFRSADEWFRHAEPEFAAMMTWHAAEEIEHRHVAYDVLRAVSTSYPLRARALFSAVARTWLDLTPVVTYMLEVDGYGRVFASRMRRWRLRARFVGELVPAIARYITPGYHPSQERAPAGYSAWLRDNSPAPSAQADSGRAAQAPSP
jgi:predicted metal-dependent hydrolase